MTLIVDSYAWIEFLSAGRSGPAVRAALGSSEDLVTPDHVLAEVARKLGRDGMAAEVIRGHLRSITALSTVRPIDIDLASATFLADKDLRQRARERKLGPPSFADAVILAFARHLGGKVLTGDRHFEGMGETAWVGR